jgi:cytochrome c oxidase subunit 4
VTADWRGKAMTHEQQQANTRPGERSSHEELGHVVSIRTLVAVFALLIALTIATVTAANLGVRQWEIWITLGIATIKGSLVAAYFMHLRYDKPFHAFIFVVALAFATLFLVLTLLDTQQYQPDVERYTTETANR